MSHVFAERAADGADFSLFPVGSQHAAGRRPAVCQRYCLCNPQRIAVQAPPKVYGSYKTPYKRFIRWSWMSSFDRIFAALASEGPKLKRIMIDVAHLRAHCTAAKVGDQSM